MSRRKKRHKKWRYELWEYDEGEPMFFASFYYKADAELCKRIQEELLVKSLQADPEFPIYTCEIRKIRTGSRS